MLIYMPITKTLGTPTSKRELGSLLFSLGLAVAPLAITAFFGYNYDFSQRYPYWYIQHLPWRASGLPEHRVFRYGKCCSLILTRTEPLQQSVGAIAAIVGAQYWWFNRKKNVFGGAWIRIRLILPVLLVAITAAWAEGQLDEQSGDKSKSSHMARHSNMFSRLLRADIISPKFPFLWPRLIALFSVVSFALQLLWPNFSRRTTIIKVWCYVWCDHDSLIVYFA